MNSFYKLTGIVGRPGWDNCTETTCGNACLLLIKIGVGAESAEVGKPRVLFPEVSLFFPQFSILCHKFLFCVLF